MRVRSTTRARRLLVPSARTEEALVRMAGATTAVKTAKGLPATRLYCTARPFFPVVDSANLACGGLASSRISCLRLVFRAEDGIRAHCVTGVQTCALPMCRTCTSADRRDWRTRTGALIETQGKRLLIDTPPELRLQLVAAGVDHIGAVLFTHAHADHVHGIDDLRALSVRQGVMLPAYGSRGTMAELASKFPYIFDPSIVVPAGTS